MSVPADERSQNWQSPCSARGRGKYADGSTIQQNSNQNQLTKDDHCAVRVEDGASGGA